MNGSVGVLPGRQGWNSDTGTGPSNNPSEGWQSYTPISRKGIRTGLEHKQFIQGAQKKRNTYTVACVDKNVIAKFGCDS